MESQRYVIRERIQFFLSRQGMAQKRIYEEVDTQTGKVLVVGSRRKSIKAWVDRDNAARALTGKP